MKKVICLTADQYSDWDKFVASSPQGTIFSTTKWLQLLERPFQIYAYYGGGNILGGMANFDEPAPLTPFQGILVQPLPDTKYVNQVAFTNEVTNALIEYAPKNFYNHYTFTDLRPFKWNGYQHFDIRYTYVVDLSDLKVLWGDLEKQTRYEIISARREYSTWMTPEIGVFDRLYEQTFARKELARPVNTETIRKLYMTFNALLVSTCNLSGVTSMVVIIEDSKRAYYILGASAEGHTSSLTLWAAFEYLSKSGTKEIDLVGANDKSIALFKRGFAGKLMPYYGVKK